VEVKKMNWKKTLLFSSLLVVIGFSTFIVGTNMGYYTGFKKGYITALNDVKNYTGIEFKWEDLGRGKYKITAYYFSDVLTEGYAEVHLNIKHYRNGILLSNEFGAGVLTNGGKDWLEQQISGTINASQSALYCADSNDATDPPLATWTILPSEITTNGLDRQTGAYTSTGTGAWNVSVTKSVTGTQSTQLWGLHWVVTDNSDNNLLCADSGPSQKNCVNGDTLAETWQISVS